MIGAVVDAGSLDSALAYAQGLLASNPALAADAARRILQATPDHPLALLTLAAANDAAGNTSAAVSILKALTRNRPDLASAHARLALTLHRTGNRAAAIASLRRSLALDPTQPQAWRQLGDFLLAGKDRAGAESAYLAHVGHAQHDPVLMLAAAALQANRIPEAEARLRDHLKQAPTDVAAIRMLAEVAVRLDRGEDAEHLLERCLELAPGFREARHNYAIVLHRVNKPAQAIAELERLLRNDPVNPAYRNLKAAVLCRTGDYEPAIALYADLLREYPQQAQVWLSYGHALKTAGHPERAIAAYCTCIGLDPDFGEAYWSLANLKTFRFDDVQLGTMQRALERGDLGDEHRLHLEFAVGKALEDRADYAQSFRHYASGNALRLRKSPYDADDTTARLRRIPQIYTAGFFRERAGSGCAAPDPVFIVGLPRSGSTLIEQILSSHSAVEGTMELPEIISMTRALRRAAADGRPAAYHEALTRMHGDELRELGQQYIERTRIHRKLGRPLFIDKMPNNFAHIGLIHLALPNAKIIDARRHPLACCLSGFKQHFARGQNFSYSLGDLGRYYRDYVQLMEHFDAVLPGRIHRVIYEEMVENTEHEVRRLLEYCGLPFEAACLRFFENERPVRTASSEQVRQPIYREGMDYWRHYEPWLGPLKTALGETSA
ncbi:MAG: sulfotransferase [Rudaea sp.]|nr:sulfotransferase [Rudaea sp.]